MVGFAYFSVWTRSLSQVFLLEPRPPVNAINVVPIAETCSSISIVPLKDEHSCLVASLDKALQADNRFESGSPSTLQVQLESGLASSRLSLIVHGS